jgi:ubiquinone/menaquinone biosynthesis C-methylase UbiE
LEGVRVSDGYHETRLAADPRRAKVWRALWQNYFRHRITPDDVVLDLGAGHCDFINAVTARKRIAIDAWHGLRQHVAADVEAIVGSVTDLTMIADDSVDYAFSSNLLEHLTKAEIVEMLHQLRRKLTAKGRLTLLQPNYRYAYKEYFDDYTHITVFSHISLVDFLGSCGWEVTGVKPRFLPLTVKSRMPTHSFLIALYLALPIKPLGKQMLVEARPTR